MSRTRMPSPQTAKVLLAMAGQPAVWRYGYELGLEVGLKSGALYPILMRLADRQLLEAVWEENPPLGRPGRHLYRLTPQGLSVAAAVPIPGVRAATGRRQPRFQTGFAT
jgi:PadR family transcriptional regulator, regulatory protein PadR